ncbi:nicotinate-nucleotide-dimethylbenzimidazole phosphoribosyltransferase [Marinobacter daqiaonensis]|uniref:Nicotinate-nucleotide--dimethylbenzimidazole phosphoribosyltransferase n=1 Tax=Marinobacter daqiaonensis TaxID=650891 RepID=A0A1I6JNF5_9GAMM|nr:nicotinate-nucleotide--dimethylbenzimidazole phosphoribosyltransferase [Marinobacter daqiaonensis]SFR80469.1 nicotinate-nucleotide-dimethylbenzimidazole phosphoribosyltransferase [Marinobacter daqiaonensis]
MNAPSAWTVKPPAPDPAARERARERQNGLTKPRGSLGRLEQLAITLCALQATDRPSVERVAISVFAGDHGVCTEGISAFPQEVTAQMIANFASGGAAISVLANHLGASLDVVNVGTVTPPDHQLPGVRHEMVSAGTANLARQPAMTDDQAVAALRVGDTAAARAAENHGQLFIGGDMGIGNTTAAAALACALLDEDPRNLVGPGTGLDSEGVSHKARVVERALERHGTGREPLSVLASLGGLEIAALTGAILGAASRRIPVLVDGFIVSVAALVAVRQQPALRDWLFFAHRSAEPGHQRVLAALDAQPLLDLGMRLGEGSGAAVAVPLMRLACDLHNDMASFEDAGVSNRS